MKKAQIKEYKQLSLSERVEIYSLLKQGKKLREIASFVGRDVSTVSRELKRNKSRCDLEYSPVKAQENAQKKALNQRTKAPLKSHEIYLYVREKLRNEGWSPQIISGRIGIDKPGYSISKEAIYQYIYGKGKHFKLWKYLPERHKKRRIRAGRKVQRAKRQSKIPGAISIDMRLKRANDRSQIGHLETDLMEGTKKEKVVVSVSVDRKTRHTNLEKMKSKTAQEKQKVLTIKLKTLQFLEKAGKPIVRSITSDNGTENTRHQEISEILGIKYYYCHPYHSWEKGTVENTIKRIRRYVPKETSLKRIKKSQIQWIEDKINNTPMKVLNFLTPNEAMEKEVNKYKFKKYKNSQCCTST